MSRFIIRRLLLMIPTFFGITLVCFAVMRMANANPMTANLEVGLRSGAVSKEAIKQLRKIYHLDEPWYDQYLHLLRRLVTLNLGTTWQDGRPITTVIGEALPITALLALISLFIAYLIAIPLGIYSAVRQYSLLDQVSTVILFALYSLPNFWVGTMLLIYLAGGHFLNWFPLQGWHAFQGFSQMSFAHKVGDIAWHIVLPVATLSYASFAALSRYMRSGMLETIRQDFIRTARAKGLSERTVIFKHALRNSVIPILTILGGQVPLLIAGAVIVETIFGIPGMGWLALKAIQLPDYPTVISLVAFTGILTMLGILLSDVAYALVDPRITFDKDS